MSAINQSQFITPRDQAFAIVDEVASYYSITREEIMGKCKEYRLAWPRQVAHKAVLDIMGWPLTLVGRFFDRCHTTISNNSKRVEGRYPAGHPIIEAHLRRNHVVQRAAVPLPQIKRKAKAISEAIYQLEFGGDLPSDLMAASEKLSQLAKLLSDSASEVSK